MAKQPITELLEPTNPFLSDLLARSFTDVFGSSDEYPWGEIAPWDNEAPFTDEFFWLTAFKKLPFAKEFQLQLAFEAGFTLGDLPSPFFDGFPPAVPFPFKDANWENLFTGGLPGDAPDPFLEAVRELPWADFWDLDENPYAWAENFFDADFSYLDVIEEVGANEFGEFDFFLFGPENTVDLKKLEKAIKERQKAVDAFNKGDFDKANKYAEKSIEEFAKAAAIVPDHKYLEKAGKEFGKAFEELWKGDFADAAKYFGKAWEAKAKADPLIADPKAFDKFEKALKNLAEGKLDKFFKEATKADKYGVINSGLDGPPPGPPALLVVQEFVPSLFQNGDVANPFLARIAGQSADLADYSLGGPDADALDLILAPNDLDPDDGLTEILVRGAGGIVSLAGTGSDDFYDFFVELTVDGQTSTTDPLSIELVTVA